MTITAKRDRQHISKGRPGSKGSKGRQAKPVKLAKPAKPGIQKGGNDSASTPQAPIYDYPLIAKYSFSIYILMSYVLFGIATILFIYACINFPNISNVNTTPNNVELIDTPLFNYLKKSNFMDIDRSLLNYGGKSGEPSIVFWIIFSIIIVNLGIFAFTKYTLKGAQKESVDAFIKARLPNTMDFVLSFLPYIFLFIAAVSHNVIQDDIIKQLEDIDVGGIDYKGDRESLRAIKRIIQMKITDAKPSAEYNQEAYKEYIYKEPQPAPGAAASAPGAAETDTSDIKYTKKLKINIKNIIDIYNANNKGDSEARISHYKIEYIGHIEKYFDLLEYKDCEKDLYTKYYFIGLINNQNALPADIKKHHESLSAKMGITKMKLIQYYWSVIGTYIAICSIAIVYLVWENLRAGTVSFLVFGNALLTRYRIFVLLAVLGMIFILVYSFLNETFSKILGAITSLAVVIGLLIYSFMNLQSQMKTKE
jgi:hypothetical protein